MHPTSTSSLPATTTVPTPIPTSSASSPPPAAPSSSYPLRDRSTLVRPERDLPEPSVPSTEPSGGRREKFLDQFLASVAPFPAQLHAKLTRMRELDEACVVRMREMDEHSKQHIHNIRHKWSALTTHTYTYRQSLHTALPAPPLAHCFSHVVCLSNLSKEATQQASRLEPH